MVRSAAWNSTFTLNSAASQTSIVSTASHPTHYLQLSRESVMLNGNKEVKVATTAVLSRTEVKRLGKFGIIGIINTLLDFVIYNLLSSHAGLTLVQSNMVSTTAAMVFSFIANKKMVFKKANGVVLREVLLFLAVTAFGL